MSERPSLPEREPESTAIDPLSVSDKPVPLHSILSRAVAQEGGLVDGDGGAYDEVIAKAAERLRWLEAWYKVRVRKG